MARFGKQSIAEVDAMTLTEFYCLSYAQNERDLYDEYKMHKQAYLNREIEAQKKVGKESKLVYKTFKDFFDYEKVKREMYDHSHDKKEKEQNKNILEMLKHRNEQIKNN
ncbi:hypothetical protein [Macrococcus armenti]|uniref:hypothetical protein n=1 Tax=Macrococcus armenti TaxID=2875764 RepID=UPI001CCB872E|nr:hypothetical protein [Macrococcus armenti]UBH16406.1 hypothetical protein LAU44_05470 [Macrococcus armenti]UBH18762.1 hypothetical protein LAU39_05480 [Macrococcus armenti]UBH21034.1 hypothetical protein LAU40_05475 [Macrococcus armenti]